MCSNDRDMERGGARVGKPTAMLVQKAKDWERRWEDERKRYNQKTEALTYSLKQARGLLGRTRDHLVMILENSPELNADNAARLRNETDQIDAFLEDGKEKNTK